MLVPTIFVGGCLYYLIFNLMAKEIALPDIVARDLGPVISQVNITLMIGVPLVFLFVIAWAFILSYRFLAPLERLEGDLQRIDDGDYSVRLQIQEDHDLRPVADVINDLVSKLNEGKQ